MLACFRCHCRDVSNQHLSPLYVGTLKHLRECFTRHVFLLFLSLFCCVLLYRTRDVTEHEILFNNTLNPIYKGTVSWLILQVVQRVESSTTEEQLIKCILRCKFCIYFFLWRWYHIIYIISKTVGPKPVNIIQNEWCYVNCRCLFLTCALRTSVFSLENALLFPKRNSNCDTRQTSGQLSSLPQSILNDLGPREASGISGSCLYVFVFVR